MKLLFDTCVVLKLNQGGGVLPKSARLIGEAKAANTIYLSPITGWEIGLLSRPERKRPMTFLPSNRGFLHEVFRAPGTQIAELTPEIMFSASHLPWKAHDDPADWILMATSIAFDITLLTDDERILHYGKLGHLRTHPFL